MTHNPDLEGLVERAEAAEAEGDRLRTYAMACLSFVPDHVKLSELREVAEALSTIQPPAIEDERGKIVAWLRELRVPISQRGWIAEISAAIERGEHSGTPSPLNGDVVEALVERVARAIFRVSFHPEEDDEIIEAKWGEWPTDRDQAFRRARAALSSLSSGEGSGDE